MPTHSANRKESAAYSDRERCDDRDRNRDQSDSGASDVEDQYATVKKSRAAPAFPATSLSAALCPSVMLRYVLPTFLTGAYPYGDKDKHPHVSKKNRLRYEQMRRLRLVSLAVLFAIAIMSLIAVFGNSSAGPSAYSKNHAPHRGFTYRSHLHGEHEHHLHGSERDLHVHAGNLQKQRPGGAAGVLEKAKSFLQRTPGVDSYGNPLLEPVWAGDDDSLFFDMPAESSPEPYFCPCCGWQGSEFASYNGRPDAGCPVCGVSERHRFACYLFQSELQPAIKAAADTQPQRFLHFNPSEQLVRRLDRVPNFDQILADYRPDIPGLAHIDPERIALPRTFLDGVLVVHVLEHVRDDAAALAEITRVLKPDAWMIVEVPCHSNLDATVSCAADGMSAAQKAEVCGHENHFRRYSCAGFRDALAAAGFDCHLPRMTQDDLARLTSHIIPKQFVCWRALEEDEDLEQEEDGADVAAENVHDE